MLKIKIGITTRDDGSIWSNGLDQNIYFLYKMLEDMGHSPTLVSETQKSNMLVDLPVVKLNLKNIDNFDLILEVAHPISEKLTNYFNSSSDEDIDFLITFKNSIKSEDLYKKLNLITKYSVNNQHLFNNKSTKISLKKTS